MNKMSYKNSSKCRRRKLYRKDIELKEYIHENKRKRVHIVTTRFTNETWNENRVYCEKHKNKLQCAYGVPLQTNNGFTSDDVLFVLEMNNEENEIMGIGMVKNQPLFRNSAYNIYDNQNYNRYVYLGKTRIDRSEMNEEEENICKVFDNLCFTGKRHQKRLSGIKEFPMDMLYRMSKKAIELGKTDLVDFIVNMFKQRLTK